MKTVFHMLHSMLVSHESCVLVSAVGGSGSVPRKTHAHMLVGSEGRICGTVGGGAIEGRAIELAKQLMKDERSCTQQFVLQENDVLNLGMICGGEVTLHFRYISSAEQDMIALAERAVDLFESGKRAWLIIQLETHALSLYEEEKITGADIPPEVLAVFKDGGVHCTDVNHAYYTEMLVSPGKVYIFGGGHVAQALVPVLASVDFRCVVLEDRAEFANPALFPLADSVRLISPDEWTKALHVSQEDCICIMTRGHKNDLDCQAFALNTDAYYIGVIGSRRKITSVNAQLSKMGFEEKQVARVHTPIGLPILAQTPAEIAVSIAAEMIRCRAEHREK